MKIIDLLNKIANNEEVPKYIQYYNMLKGETDIMMVCKENIFYKLDQLEIQLNSRVEIIEEERELHANKIVFNCDNSKRECVINLDENDLGIDKLHIDNCYFYKENDKWYVRKYDFKTFNLEEKRIPEKLIIGVTEYDEIHINNEISTERQVREVADKLNEVLDYLQSKGE